MVKSKKGAKPKMGKKKQLPGRSRLGGITLDGQAVDHINLLADPCQGKLVAPAYPSTGGGAIIRFRRVVDVGTGAGETAGMFHWIPGVNEYFANGGATAGTLFTPSAQSVFSYLTTTSGTGNSGLSFRCVAACAKILTNASEQNRSGIVYAGLTDGVYYTSNSGSSTTTAASIVGLPFSARSPSKFLEILWVASQSDVDFTSDLSNTGASVAQAFANRNAISFGFYGAPAANGYAVEMTAVYEIDFPAANSIVSSKGPPASATPWNTVVSTFYRAINNAPVVVDGVRKAIDYVANAGPGTIGGYAARAAVGMLL